MFVDDFTVSLYLLVPGIERNLIPNGLKKWKNFEERTGGRQGEKRI